MKYYFQLDLRSRFYIIMFRNTIFIGVNRALLVNLFKNRSCSITK
jgi:hypothetical protein